MDSKYSKTALMIVLCVMILLASVSTGFAKYSKKHYSHRKYSSAKTEQISGNLVLRSAAALVEDQETGKRLIQKQASTILPIASITKLMTAMVVLDADRDLKEWIAIENGDIDTLRHSHSRLPVGTELSRKDAMLLALMSSDNRAAHALGRTYPGGTEACVAAMNAKARSLGLLETRFEDTTGLSCSNVSSARDLVRLVDTAYQYDLIREFTTCKKAFINTGWRSLEFNNTNQLVRNSAWQIGLSKTGFTGDAGRCLVMQANVAQRPVLIVLLDSQGKMTRIGDANRIKRWLEAQSPSQRMQQRMTISLAKQ
ncbi:MAG: D-alanyl-D-alanine endopeptidase [Smithella sp.]|jgi:D-alanyl-D-alanine endopeptidase (penicillin-binding protein 7)